MAEGWQEDSVHTIGQLFTDISLLPRSYGVLSSQTVLQMSDSTVQKLQNILHDSILKVLQNLDSHRSLTIFLLGIGLKSYARNVVNNNSVDGEFWISIYGMVETFRTLPPYLESILITLQSGTISLGDETQELLASACTENLHSPSHALRRASLEILGLILGKKYGKPSKVVTTALGIERTPLNLESARKISLCIRQLTSQFLAALPCPWLEEAIAHFCYGLLTYRLSSVWTEVVSALSEICESQIAEETFARLAFRWLSEPRQPLALERLNDIGDQRLPLTAFQCSNVEEAQKVFRKSRDVVVEPQKQLLSSFEKDHQRFETSAANATSLAIRVLTAVPNVAEKRSRQLVPIFLTQVSKTWHEHVNEEGLNQLETPISNLAVGKLSRRDQKALLDLFGQFNNPTVLFRSSDVYDALLSLLASGDAETQRAALKAIFTWKDLRIKPYQDSLLNLVDDARFRDEMAVFVNVHDEHSIVQDSHREHLMPILLRLLYGKVSSRAGKGASHQPIIRKRAIFQSLAHFRDQDIIEFIRIAFGDLYDETTLVKTVQEYEERYMQNIDVRKRLGLLNVVKALLINLGHRLTAFTAILANSVFCCLLGSSRQLKNALQMSNDQDSTLNGSLVKDVRQTGLQCVNLMYLHCAVGDLQGYVELLFSQIINPRLELLPIETAQSVSGILQLFSTWSKLESTTSLFVEPNPDVMDTLGKCLMNQSAKDEVIAFILDDIWLHIVCQTRNIGHDPGSRLSSAGSPPGHVLQSSASSMLKFIASLLRKGTASTIQASAIRVIVGIAPFITMESQVNDLVEVSTKLLEQPTQRVGPKTKGDLLQILQRIIQNPDVKLTQGMSLRIYEAISPLFAYFSDRGNRLALSNLLSVVASSHEELREVANLCASLNSYAPNKIDEPDFDTRLGAFRTINDNKDTLTDWQWLPLIHNSLFFVKDRDELAIRSSASLALKSFVEKHDNFGETSNPFIHKLMEKVLLPALRKGVYQQSELVRAEYLGLMAHLIRHNATWVEIKDMSTLLVDDDEEASFFSNILHIQQHRRLRAMKRLGTEARKGRLSGRNTAHFFLPLLEQFIFEEEADENAHNFCAEAVITVGALAASLEWPQWRAVLRRYTGFIARKPGKEKTVIKLLGLLIGALPDTAATPQESLSDSGHIVVDAPVSLDTILSKTMPTSVKLVEDITRNLVPPLVRYLHDKNESTVSLRVPVAVAISKLLLQLPSEDRNACLPPVLTDVTNILRSRSQESRDLTRKTLVEIAKLLGPHYLGFILKELKGSLQRGYQLHVLSYTVHSILIATSDEFGAGDLDYCLPQIVSIIMDDIFGVTGQEKDAEEYISKMKEVKSSKSQDSMEHVARTTAVDKLFNLFRPLQEIIVEKVDHRVIRKVDELLRRIGVGLLRNKDAQDRRILIFCHELIRNTYNKGLSDSQLPNESRQNKRILIDMRASSGTSRGGEASYDYKLIKFGLDMTRSVVQRHDTLQTAANLSGFMPFISDALVGSEEEIQVAAARLLSTIIKLPLKEIDDNAGYYVVQAVKIVRNCTSTSTELAQAALKLVSSILRERKQVAIREVDIAYLLKRLIPDLEEPDRQGIAFNFLKAVITKKVMITEIYEAMDTVAVLLVTNQSRNTRDQARGLYLQFIMNYPQGKGRYTKQLAFFIKNLDYKHEDGRRSVMEALHLLLSRFGDDLAQDLVEAAFVPLVMNMINDEVSDCKEMAAALVRALIERADEDRRRTLLALLRSWLTQAEQPSLIRIGLHIYGLYLDAARNQAEKELPLLLSTIGEILQRSVFEFDGEDWEYPYLALETFAKICQTYSAQAFKGINAPIWANVRKCQALPHAWIKFSAAKLIGLLFADFTRASASQGHIERPLIGSGGLKLDADEMAEMMRLSLRSLQVPNLSEDLASQLTKNLVFLGKHMAQTCLPSALPQAHEEIQEHDEVEAMDNEDSGASDTASNSQVKSPQKTGAAHILSHASYLLRRGPPATTVPALLPLHASLRLLASLSRILPLPSLMSTIPTVLLALHNLTDPSIPPPTSPDPTFTESYKTLVTNAQELMSFLQEKIGTAEYVNVLGEVRQEVKGRREERRTKRRVEAVNEVERRQRRKVRKLERGKERRKEKGQWEQGRRRGW